MTDPVPVNDMPTSKYADDKSFDIVSSSGNYLPRIQLFGGNSGPAKEGKIGIGRWGFVKGDSIIDLTPEFNCLCVSWRPKAMRISGDQIVSSFNPQNPMFKKIQVDSEIKDSGCMFGPEYLLWVAGLGKFATLFMSSKTMRKEAPNLKALLGQAATLKVKFIKTIKYSWHGPVVTVCSTPLTNLPSEAEVREQASIFCNPPESGIEAATTASRET